MKITRFLAPAALVGGAALFLVPTATDAYAVLGFSLGLSQRDFRIFNNFSDAQANNNQTPHEDYPAYQGADMAFWKAAVEWGSSRHGTGTNKEKVGKLTQDQVRAIVQEKQKELGGLSEEANMRIIAGTARSMGVVVEGMEAE